MATKLLNQYLDELSGDDPEFCTRSSRHSVPLPELIDQVDQIARHCIDEYETKRERDILKRKEKLIVRSRDREKKKQ